jgi:anti-anti-sigma regulatory factor
MDSARVSYEPLDEHTASITVAGEIDVAISYALERIALAATGDGKNDLLVDLTRVSIADATLIESLFHVGRLLERMHGSVVAISTPGSRVRDALYSAGLDERMRMAATRREALTEARDETAGAASGRLDGGAAERFS